MSGCLWAKFVQRKKSKLILSSPNLERLCWQNCSTKSSKVRKVLNLEKVERRSPSRGRRPFPDTRTSSNWSRSTKTSENRKKWKKEKRKNRLKKTSKTIRNVDRQTKIKPPLQTWSLPKSVSKMVHSHLQDRRNN
jgi:hypothetical protein